MEPGISDGADRRTVSIQPKTAEPVMGRQALTALLLLMATMLGCQSPPEWWLRRHQPERDAEGAANLAAIRDARAGREQLRSAALQRSEDITHDASAIDLGLWSSQTPSAVPSSQLTLPPAHLVRPPTSRKALKPAPPVRDETPRVVPPYTTIVPSPHPGVRCGPDLLGGQRCFSTP